MLPKSYIGFGFIDLKQKSSLVFQKCHWDSDI